MFSLKGRVCLITGGATGIGYQVARAFAEAGASVVLAYNSSEGPAKKCIEELQRDFNIKAEAIKIPATDPEEVERGVKKVEETFGRLDVVRLCARGLALWTDESHLGRGECWYNWDVRHFWSISRGLEESQLRQL